MTSRVWAVAVCAGFVGTGFAWAQSAAARPDAPPTAGHHEVQRDPYLPPDNVPGPRAPGLRVDYGRYTSVQVNVDANGNDIPNDAANEPSIAVNPLDPYNMVIGWREFSNINSDFRRAGNGYTTDGGVTWTVPGVIDPLKFRSDPVLCADLNGVFYYNSLTNDPNFQCRVFRSYDGGATWDGGVYAEGGDKQWMVIDQTAGPGSGNIYAFWTEVWSVCSGQFTHSLDGGDSYEACTYIPGSPYWGTLAVGPAGEVYVCGDGFTVARSDMLKLGIPTWQFNTTVNLGGSQQFSVGPNPGGLLGQVYIAVDSSGGPTNGYVYMLCSVDPPGADPMDVMFSRSTNNGQTWSPPLKINDDGSGANLWQWFGTLSVAPNGRIDVIWNDTRNNPQPGVKYWSQVYYATSSDGGLTWSPNEALTPSFDPHLGWPQQNKIGDYYHMHSDNRGANLAFSATFNGQQNVYYMRIGDPLEPIPPTANDDSYTADAGVPLLIELSARDDGLPDPPAALTYVITALPQHGTLRDPGAGLITAAPYTLVNGGKVVEYMPSIYYNGADAFQFLANDGGVPPEGGDSNVATVTLEIAIAPSRIHWFPLDTNPGWSTEGLWAFGVPAGGGSHAKDPASGYTGANVYGYNLNGDYTNNMPARHLTTAALDLSGATAVELRFWRRLGVEFAPQDNARVQVSNDGSNWVTVWQNGSTSINDTTWTQHTYSLAAVADDQPTVYVRWTMGTTDAGVTYPGWNLDDIALWGVVKPRIAGDLDCSGAVDFGDINPFVLLLSNPTQWEALFPDCNVLNGDINDDGAVDFGDINPFVSLLSAP